MKGARKQESKQSKQLHVNTGKPKERDEIDSRKDKEAGFRGNDNKPTRKVKQAPKPEPDATELRARKSPPHQRTL
jgi:hypothetical protein